MPESQKNDPLRIAVAGLGTVGAGVLKLLAEQADIIEQRCGRRIEVVAVSARSRGKDRGIDLSTVEWYDDPVKLAAHPGAFSRDIAAAWRSAFVAELPPDLRTTGGGLCLTPHRTGTDGFYCHLIGVAP